MDPLNKDNAQIITSHINNCKNNIPNITQITVPEMISCDYCGINWANMSCTHDFIFFFILISFL